MDLYGSDSTFLNDVFFCVTKDSCYYYSKIRTSVCEDKLCRIVHLKVYWDLAGNYLNFDTIPGLGLTKNNHNPFTEEDYIKIHHTLRNDNSILGEKTKDELLDKSENRYSEKIDGYTGATAKEIKKAVVDGALYSTHTLWNLINEEIRIRLKEYTISN
ncbi:MAG: hypothetical protein ACOCUP_00330 [bacterium]